MTARLTSDTGRALLWGLCALAAFGWITIGTATAQSAGPATPVTPSAPVGAASRTGQSRYGRQRGFIACPGFAERGRRAGHGRQSKRTSARRRRSAFTRAHTGHCGQVRDPRNVARQCGGRREDLDHQSGGSRDAARGRACDATNHCHAALHHDHAGSAGAAGRAAGARQPRPSDGSGYRRPESGRHHHFALWHPRAAGRGGARPTKLPRGIRRPGHLPGTAQCRICLPATRRDRHRRSGPGERCGARQRRCARRVSRPGGGSTGGPERHLGQPAAATRNDTASCGAGYRDTGGGGTDLCAEWYHRFRLALCGPITKLHRR